MGFWSERDKGREEAPTAARLAYVWNCDDGSWRATKYSRTRWSNEQENTHCEVGRESYRSRSGMDPVVRNVEDDRVSSSGTVKRVALTGTCWVAVSPFPLPSLVGWRVKPFARVTVDVSSHSKKSEISCDAEGGREGGGSGAEVGGRE